MKIVVTGKTGVGKTTILKSLGFQNTLYLDQLVKDTFYVKGHELFAKVVKRFGQEIVVHNKIDTKILGMKVLPSASSLHELTNLTAPFVIAYIEKLKGDWLIEMAPYINDEKRYRPLFDDIVLVTRNEALVINKFSYAKNSIATIKDIDIFHNLKIVNDFDLTTAIDALKAFLNDIGFQDFKS